MPPPGEKVRRKTPHRTPQHGKPRKPEPAPLPPGLAVREAAVRLIAAVLIEHHSLDEVLAKELTSSPLEPRDRALARLIAATVLRRRGELEAVLTPFLEKPLPARQGNLWPILLAGTAQLLFLDTPPHAAVGLAVEQTRHDRRARNFDRLVNALLRRVTREGAAALEGVDAAKLNIPAWLYARWERAYGPETAHRIAQAVLAEAALDVTVKSEPELWAERLGGIVLPTGSVRLHSSGRIDALPGFEEGAWWVQDAAAALPARLLGDVAGRTVVDMCAAPGGKTAELAAAGAKVTALDLSAARLGRLTQNLARLKLEATLVEADAAAWNPGHTFDAVLLDAPCTATGTIRRHPDILHLKREGDLVALAELQSRMLDNAANLVAPAGLLVYCTCSLEPEEGAEQIARFLARNDGFERVAIEAGESGISPDWLTQAGELRTLPFHLQSDQPQLSGMDGFFAARLRRRG